MLVDVSLNSLSKEVLKEVKKEEGIDIFKSPTELNLISDYLNEVESRTHFHYSNLFGVDEDDIFIEFIPHLLAKDLEFIGTNVDINSYTDCYNLFKTINGISLLVSKDTELPHYEVYQKITGGK
jgi:hypothetical protein